MAPKALAWESERGLLFFGPNLITASHAEFEMEFSLKVMAEVIEIFEKAYRADKLLDLMEGKLVEPIFRKP